MIQGEIDSLNKQMSENRLKLSNITSVKDITLEAARLHFEEVSKKMRALEVEIQEKKLKKRQNEQEIVELEDASKLVKRMEDKLRDLMPDLDSRGARSLDKSVGLFLETIDAKIKELQVTGTIDSLREKAERIEPIVSYLVKMEDFKQRAGEELNIDKELDKISYKILKLEDFETSLQNIREIVCGHQNELTLKSLEEFQSSINYYYGQIIGHPFFKKLKIEPIAGEPVAYDL